MPVRDQIASASASKSRSGMFKWMISGHKGHKHKQEKLNNAVSNKNKNNLKQQQNNHNNSSAAGSGQQHEQGSGEQQLHMSETNNSSAYNNQVNSTQEHSSAEHVNSGVSGGDINQNVEKCDNVANTNGLSGGLDSDTPPPLPSSRPPPPPSHPPPPVPPHGPALQSMSQHPQPPLPPVPGQEEQRPLQAPGTCTLPRRGFAREEPGARFRSPSNPPPASRQPYQPPPQHQPPPYARHQPPDPATSRRSSRGPYQPPPPPKMDAREPREGREREPRDPRDHRDARDAGELQWDARDYRGQQDARDHSQDGRNFRDIRESWERRNTKEFPRDERAEDAKTASLPRGAYEAWHWPSRELDSGFDSLTPPGAGDGGGPRSLDSLGGRGGRGACPHPGDEATYSQSTEDLLNASRTSPVSIASAATTSSSSASSSPSPVQYPTIRPAKQPCAAGAAHPSAHAPARAHGSPHASPGGASPLSLGGPQHHSTPLGPPRAPSPEEALLSDSVYPDAQPRYAEIPDASARGKDDRGGSRVSRDLRELRDPRDARESRKDLRESQEARASRENLRLRGFRETSLPRDFRDSRDPRGSYLEVRDDRGFRELSVDDTDDLEDDLDPRLQERLRGRRDSRQYASERGVDPAKEARVSRGEALRVRDMPAAAAYERRDRNADGADGLQVMDEHRGQRPPSARAQPERRGDGCPSTSSSVSWMEWTQQLQAYVAWVNSQLRKRGRPLISDLRRDLQSGVVFADLIEIISGEHVAGVTRAVDSPQVMRENLDRVLQFMAAKRIRMTHITSKEVVEGNLKSVMRIILALAAHYKPQSVKGSNNNNNSSSSSTSPQHHQESSPLSSSSAIVAGQAAPSSAPSGRSSGGAPPPTTHDVGVGPDAPPSSTAPEKTPNLSANRRMMAAGASAEDAGGVVGLRRHPSMTGTPAAARDSSPVYENLPRRVASNRWAYDSLRASHKFQWGGGSSSHARRGPGGAPVVPPKPSPNLDESSDDPLNSSFNASLNTSLNTSMEGDAEVSSPRRDSSGSRGGSTRPAALNFWQDLTRKDANFQPPPEALAAPGAPQKQAPAADDSDNPFRYHTIHRMSGRRKLPQIPGAAAGPSSNSSRVTTPLESQDSPRDYLGDERGGGMTTTTTTTTDEGSREPEGRSQNSSPATSLVREATLDQWPREKGSLDPWEQEDLKGVLRDLNTTRDQLLALQNLELDPASRSSHAPRSSENKDGGSAAVKQELLHLSLARQALEAEKGELSRLLEQREGIITELRKQMHQRDKTIQAQRVQFEEALRNSQNGKRDSSAARMAMSGGAREELQLVRDAISSLRSNFRETDPNQHTLDTLEQAIAVLIERAGSGISGGVNGVAADKSSRPSSHDKRPVNGMIDSSTKVIYFTERTVTPFMSTINRRLGDIRLRDFKSMFDRPGLFRFHFKSHDPEYGMVKEEIFNDDDILPGVDGKIIAWVEEDTE